jgi:hypothetical protein
MIWNPWARLRRMEQQLRQQVSAIETLSRELATAEFSYRELVERTIQMRREGFGPAVPLPEKPAAVEPLPPEVLRAVLAVAEPGIEQYARSLLASGLSAKETAESVLAGGAIPV